MRQRSGDWLDHALRRANWQPQRQVVALAALGFFVALLLGGLYLAQVASDAVTNRHLSELLAERDELERVNEQLRADIAALKSVPRLYARAVELGFSAVADAQIEYLVVPEYVPARVDTVAPVSVTTGDSGEEAVYTETFADWVQRQWRALLEAFGGA